MTSAQIEGLVERLEKATGPDRELDGLIERTLQRGIFRPIAADMDEGDVLEIVHHRPGHGWPRYTASIDAALMLVPEGMIMELFECDPPGDGTEYGVLLGFSLRFGEISKPSNRGTGATPAIALCIAALRALAAQEKPPQQPEGGRK